MNPNVSTQNPNINQTNSTTNNGPFVTPSPIGFNAGQSNTGVVNNTTPVQASSPVVTQTQTPFQNGPVTPSPMPAQNSPVTISPMPAQGLPVTPTPVSTIPVANEQTKEDPNAKLTEVSIPPSASNTSAEPQVIDTTKKKGSNILLFIIIIILVVFAINIDKMSEMYENYMKTGSLTATNVTPDNTTTSGFIKIGDSSSSMKVSNVNFYNFRKNESDLTISFNYEAFEKIDNPASLGIYIELYNTNSEILYKELFDTNSEIAMNSASNYTMTLDSDIHTNAFFALVKTYSPNEANRESNVTCKRSDNDYQYVYVYNFINNGLVSYDISKTALKDEDTSLETEYEQYRDYNASLNNKTLKYTIDLENIKDVTPEYSKGLTPTILKSRATLKEWTCE